MDAAVDFTLEETGGLEDAEMLGDGGEREGERLGELGDGGFALGQAGEDGAAGGIGECGEGGVERCGGIVNHMVYYCPGLRRCQVNFWDSGEIGGLAFKEEQISPGRVALKRSPYNAVGVESGCRRLTKG